jgi:hypothetical protein
LSAAFQFFVRRFFLFTQSLGLFVEWAMEAAASTAKHTSTMLSVVAPKRRNGMDAAVDDLA